MSIVVPTKKKARVYMWKLGKRRQKVGVHVKRQRVEFSFLKLGESGGVVCDLVEWPEASGCGTYVDRP